MSTTVWVQNPATGRPREVTPEKAAMLALSGWPQIPPPSGGSAEPVDDVITRSEMVLYVAENGGGGGGGSTPDATTSVKGKAVLLGGTAAAPTVPWGKLTEVPDVAVMVGGKLDPTKLPALALQEYLGAAASQSAMLALVGQRGDWCYRSDLGTDWQLIAEPSSTLGSWVEKHYPASPVSTVNGRTGAVVTKLAEQSDVPQSGGAVDNVIAIASVDGQGKVTGWKFAAPATGGGGGAVSSVAGRTGDVVIGWADLSGMLPTSKLPPLGITDVFPVTNQAARLALTAQRGDIAVQANPAPAKTYALATDDPAQDANWVLLPAIGSVQTVNGQQGAVVLGKGDVGLSNVDNTADADKPVSTATAAELAKKASRLVPTADIKTGNYTAVDRDLVRGDPTGGSFSVQLPAATDGRRIAVKDVRPTSSTSGGMITVLNPDGSTAVIIRMPQQTRTLSANGTEWTIENGQDAIPALDRRYPVTDQTPAGTGTLSGLRRGGDGAFTLEPFTPAPAAQVTTALAKLRAGIASRDLGPRPLVFCGSSTTAGNNATTAGRRYVNLLSAIIQGAYPLRSGSPQPAVTDLTTAYNNRASLATGLQGVNAGVAGTRADTYLTSTTRPQVAALNPRMVLHMVGSNDFSDQTPVATYKANVQAQLTALKAAITVPCVHVLVQSYERYDVTNPAISWAQYGQALAELAAADPTNVVFVDIHGPYNAIGVPGSDPADVIDTDLVHQNDVGHILMADLLREALTIPLTFAATGPDTTAPSTPTNLTASPGDTTAALTWTAATDNVAVTGYRVYRAGTLVGSPTSNGFTDTGLTNGTQYSYTVSALDAAGNESAQTSAVTVTPASGAGNTLASDSFGRADSTTSLGAADSGQTWNALAGTWGIISGKAYAPSAVGTAVVAAGSGNVDAQVDMLSAASGATIGLIFRCSDDNNRLGAFITPGTGIALIKRASGTNTTVASAAPTITMGVTYTVRVVASGNSVTVYVNGTAVLTYTLTSAEQATFGSLGGVGIRASTANSGHRFDNLLVKAA